MCCGDFIVSTNLHFCHYFYYKFYYKTEFFCSNSSVLTNCGYHGKCFVRIIHYKCNHKGAVESHDVTRSLTTVIISNYNKL